MSKLKSMLGPLMMKNKHTMLISKQHNTEKKKKNIKTKNIYSSKSLL